MNRHPQSSVAMVSVLGTFLVIGLNCTGLAPSVAKAETDGLASRHVVVEQFDGNTDNDQRPVERRAQPDEPDGPAGGDDNGDDRDGPNGLEPEEPSGCMFRKGPLELLV